MEEDYKVIKSRIALENFSVKSAFSVYQDFHAKVLMENIVSLLAQPVNDMLAADTRTDRKYDYQVNFSQALATGKNLMPLLFQGSKRKIKLIVEALFELLKKSPEPIIPGRRYPRKHRISKRIILGVCTFERAEGLVVSEIPATFHSMVIGQVVNFVYLVYISQK